MDQTATPLRLSNNNEREIIATTQMRPEGYYYRDQKSLWHMKVRSALDHLRYVPKVASEGRATRPTAEAFRAAFQFVENIDRSDLPVPMVIPGVRGSLQLEWYNGDKEINVRFGSDGVGSCCRIVHDEPIEDEHPLTDSDRWSLLNWLLT